MKYLPIVILLILNLSKISFGEEKKMQNANKLELSIAVDPRLCSYTIILKNSGRENQTFVDSLKKYASYKGKVAAYTVVFVRKENVVLGGGEGACNFKKDGYSFSFYESSGNLLPLKEDILKPDEEVKQSYSIQELTWGISKAFSLSSNAMSKCEIMIKTRIYLDGNMKNYIESNSAWFPCPQCIIDLANK